jgi:ribonuclease HII
MKTTYSLGEAIEVGLDEAGRGCFWGPIFAGAVIWPPEEEWTDEYRELAPHIKDSKKMSSNKRVLVANNIMNLAIDWGVGKVDASEIDEKGMTWANQESFRRAMQGFTSGVEPDLLLIDGVLGLPDDDMRYECIPGGDGLYLPIAAASILAKVGRDKWVTEWCESNEKHLEISVKYDLLNNKGYGTQKHREGLKEHGAHSMHREKFIRNWI